MASVTEYCVDDWNLQAMKNNTIDQSVKSLHWMIIKLDSLTDPIIFG